MLVYIFFSLYLLAMYENYGGDEGDGGAGFLPNSGTSQSPSQNKKSV